MWRARSRRALRPSGTLKEGDDTVWVFKLREGVTFHDGDEFTAEDVVFSLDRARSENSNMRQLHADVESVDRRRRLHRRSADGRARRRSIPNNVTNTFIMDNDWSEDERRRRGPGLRRRRRQLRRAQHQRHRPLHPGLARAGRALGADASYEDHWAEETPAVTEIIYLPIADAATRVAALLSGEVDHRSGRAGAGHRAPVEHRRHQGRDRP